MINLLELRHREFPPQIGHYLSDLKRSLDGTLHACKDLKYTHRHLADATWRFNRRFDLKALVPRLLVAAARCKPWPEPALRACKIRAPR